MKQNCTALLHYIRMHLHGCMLCPIVSPCYVMPSYVLSHVPSACFAFCFAAPMSYLIIQCILMSCHELMFSTAFRNSNVLPSYSLCFNILSWAYVLLCTVFRYSDALLTIHHVFDVLSWAYVLHCVLVHRCHPYCTPFLCHAPMKI